ncbi:hypothetical protein BANRA_01102 [Acinetobacter baumannii]|nr:hypothetical protein BANRA_01102 [Acinetobacter baumannii]
MCTLNYFIKTVDESEYKRTFNEELSHQENVRN